MEPLIYINGHCRKRQDERPDIMMGNIIERLVINNATSWVYIIQTKTPLCHRSE